MAAHEICKNTSGVICNNSIMHGDKRKRVGNQITHVMLVAWQVQKIHLNNTDTKDKQKYLPLQVNLNKVVYNTPDFITHWHIFGVIPRFQVYFSVDFAKGVHAKSYPLHYVPKTWILHCIFDTAFPVLKFSGETGIPDYQFSISSFSGCHVHF